MAKRRDFEMKDEKTIVVQAESHLAMIAEARTEIDKLMAAYNTEMDHLGEDYRKRLDPFREVLKIEENGLFHLMRAAKKVIFAKGDIRKLSNGILLRQAGERVVIPRTALATCEELGFEDVIKIEKSLDRDAVEKWSDERLFLIGAQRKPREDFEYEIKSQVQKGGNTGVVNIYDKTA